MQSIEVDFLIHASLKTVRREHNFQVQIVNRVFLVEFAFELLEVIIIVIEKISV